MKMLERYPLLSRFGLFVALPICVVVLIVFRQLEISISPRNGEIVVPHLRAPVEITFDAQGTPSIRAFTDHDAYFAQGFLHASERMWEMELQRRLVDGRLSEILGARAVASDHWMRILGLYRSANDAWQILDDNAKVALQAYADGVNAWIASTPKLPPEFLILGVKPEFWTPIDSLGWQKMLALDLGQNMYRELTRVAALRRMSPNQMMTFFPFDPPIGGQSYDSRQLTSSIRHDSPTANGNASAFQGEKFRNWNEGKLFFEQVWHLGVPFSGSNAWVVSGKHTKSGAPVIVSDPHLSAEQPSIWYAIQLTGDKLSVTGMSLVGVPGVLIGRNENVAWAATNSMGDQQDLFVVDVPIENNNVYRTDRGLAPIATTSEMIKVRPEYPAILNKQIEPIEIRVRRTKLGPLISDALLNSDEIYALRWSGLDPDDHSFECFFRLQYAKNWNDFVEALRVLKAPSLSFLYADVHGNIGSQVAGAIPVRGHGVGILPERAYNTHEYWQGYIPFEKLPREFNSLSGVIVAANDQISTDQTIVISHEWASPVRKERISQLIDALINHGELLDVENMSRIQLDVVDAGALRLLRLLSEEKLQKLILENAPKELERMTTDATRVVFTWDGKYTAGSTGATIYHYWVEELKRRIFHELDSKGLPLEKNALAQSLMELVQDDQIVKILSGKDDEWCIHRPAQIVDCQEDVVLAFYSALKAIKQKTKSSNADQWQWGALHRVEYAHQPFGQVKALGKLFDRIEPVGGSANTINVSIARESNKGWLKQIVGATFRQIFDLSSRSESFYILPTGQSGHFLSSHYDDMIKPFIAGKLDRFDSQDQAIARNLQRPILELMPLQ